MLREKGETGFDYEMTRDIDLAPGQVLAVQFNAAKGGFGIK